MDRTTGHFDGVDFDHFWDDGAYSRENYQEPTPSDALVAEIEAELGYRLPDAYVELARMRNGGLVERSCYPIDGDYLQITGIYAIGRTARYSLCGHLGTAFMREEWGYP